MYAWFRRPRPIDWLGQPMDEATLTARREQHSARDGVWMIAVFLSMALLLGLTLASTFWFPLSPLAQKVLGTPLVVVIVGACLLLATEPEQMQDFYPATAAQQVEGHWWLAGTPEAARLQAFLAEQPRLLYHGELRALRAARARRDALPSSSR